jgi:trimeric autotransporter adhesin
MYGLIAQEVKEAIDKHNITDFGGWDEEESSGIQSISQEMFVHPLIKAIQELSAKCDSLQNEINILKGE